MKKTTKKRHVLRLLVAFGGVFEPPFTEGHKKTAIKKIDQKRHVLGSIFGQKVVEVIFLLVDFGGVFEPPLPKKIQKNGDKTNLTRD
jgi:hypothetical protein